MPRHSERAKRNTRAQINGQIRFLKSLLSNHKQELEKMKKYRKYRLPGQAKMEKAATKRIAKTNRDIKAKQNYKAKLAREGKI